jgi:hypothetical protein
MTTVSDHGSPRNNRQRFSGHKLTYIMVYISIQENSTSVLSTRQMGQLK